VFEDVLLKLNPEILQSVGTLVGIGDVGFTDDALVYIV